MYSVVTTAMLQGIEAIFVSAEADICEGLPCMDMVGFLSGEVRESKERIRTALKNAGVVLPSKRVTINLAPANIKKTGSGLDLPIALSILCALCIVPQEPLAQTVVIGELHLDGSVSRVNGVLPIALHAREEGKKTCIVPMENVREARLVEGIEVIGIRDLKEAILVLNGSVTEPPEESAQGVKTEAEREPDFSEVAGQRVLKNICEIAVSGMHNFLMVGPPGAGKSMIARRIPSILPPLLPDERLEVSKIYSVCGMLKDDGALIGVRPFRAPHHTISSAGLSGGGTMPHPGEISLAHKGVLFLDELPEFSMMTLEILRQPLEDQKISISRVNFQVEYPADILLVAAMNPCKCGYYPSERCTCPRPQVLRYQSRISKPLMDRIDIIAQVQKPSFAELGGGDKEEPSAVIRERVKRVHQMQNERYRGRGYHYNAQLPPGDIERFCHLEQAERSYMEQTYERLSLTARGYHRILKVARTIADMEGSERIRKPHLMQALCFRGTLS